MKTLASTALDRLDHPAGSTLGWRSPQVLIRVSVLLAIAGIGCTVALNVRQQSLADQFLGLQTLENNVREMPRQLVTGLYEVKQDRALTQNLQWDLNNSVAQGLSAHLRDHEIEQLEIFDSHCRSVVRVHLHTNTPLPCPAALGPLSTLNRIFWINRNPEVGLPAVFAGIPLIGTAKEKFYLAGAVAFNAASGASTPQQNQNSTGVFDAPPNQWQLFASKHHLALVLGGAAAATAKLTPWNKPLITRAFTNTAEPLMAIYLGADRRERFVYYLLDTLSPLFRLGSILCSVAIVLLLVASLSLLAFESAAIAARFERFLTFMEETYSHASFSKVRSKIISLPILFEYLEKNFKEVSSNHNQAIVERESKNQSLQIKVSELTEKLKSRDQQLAKFDALRMLREQLTRTSTAFLRYEEGIIDVIEDLEAILNNGMRDQAKNLRLFTERWNTGIKERGIRKFIRSLAETRGRETESTALDDELADLEADSQSITDLALNASLQAQKISAAIELTKKIAILWNELARSDSVSDTDGQPSQRDLFKTKKLTANQESSSFDAVWTQFLNLSALDPILNRIQVSHSVAPPSKQMLATMPQALWVAALYHCAVAATEPLQLPDAPMQPEGHALNVGTGGMKPPGTNIGLALRMRENGDSVHLILATVAPGFKGPIPIGIQAKYQLDMVRALVSPFQIEVQHLNALRGLPQVMLSWKQQSVSSHFGGVKALHTPSASSEASPV